ncbi:MAG: hypothetical protein ACRDZ8_20165 [Acidimicrobiales bacterium]
MTRVDLVDHDWDGAVELVETFADRGLGLVDASVVAVAKRLGITAIATLNHRDFTVVRPRHTAFDLLPGTHLLAVGRPATLVAVSTTVATARHRPSICRKHALATPTSSPAT